MCLKEGTRGQGQKEGGKGKAYKLARIESLFGPLKGPYMYVWQNNSPINSDNLIKPILAIGDLHHPKTPNPRTKPHPPIPPTHTHLLPNLKSAGGADHR